MKTINDWFDEYGESHQNKTNKIIHWICIPLIFWSIIALLSLIPHEDYFKFDFLHWGTIVIFLGLLFAVFWDPILSKIGILSFVDTIGSFFGPIAGIMLVDYYVIKDKKIINKDIFSSNKEGAYFYSGGWQIKSIYSL